MYAGVIIFAVAPDRAARNAERDER